MDIVVVDNAARLAAKAANLFAQAARKAVEARGRFAVAVSGGSTPRDMHRLLAEEPYRSAVPWSLLHLFWVDERLVPARDPASNYGAARHDLLERAPIPPGNVHPMIHSGQPSSAASAYRQRLQDFFGQPESGFPVFDQIFLGIGTDGHTASIFPGDRSAVDTRLWVAAVKGGNPDVHRLTLTAPVLNQARSVIFLVTGGGKSETVKQILTDESTKLPAALIQPGQDRLLWLLDRPAAALLPKTRLTFETPSG